MRFFLFISLCAAFLTACGERNAPADHDKEFDTYKESFVLRLWEMNPAWASSVGYHKYDSVLVIPDEAREKLEKKFNETELNNLSKFDLKKLSPANQIDFKLITNYLKQSQWEMSEFESSRWDPSRYNVCGGFAEMLANNYAPLDERLHAFGIKLKSVPTYYHAARKKIENPTLEHTQLAIDQNTGGLSVFTTELETALSQSALPATEKMQIRNDAQMAVQAINSYVGFLQKLDNQHPRSFRLGRRLYARKFEFDIQSDRSAKEIYERALAHKSELHKKMVALSKELWPKYMGAKAWPPSDYLLVKEIIDTLSTRHVKPADFQKEISKQIPELEKFVRSKNLIYLDPAKPLVVRREPDYMAGVAGASISAPGPYDRNGNTYYNVGSLNGWTDEASESYLREYNNYVLQILNIHEAVPGHYTQLIYSNNAPSIIKSIFGNGAMIEGWAVYTELMMLENGYGNHSPEMWLMYYKWNLRTTCNTILDYSVHNLEMSKADAMKLLMNEAYQQQAEAEGKWKRATLTQVQLCSYFAGFTEILDLRDRLMNKQGNRFNLKKFHEELLGYGSAPVRDIKLLMTRSFSDRKN